MSLRPEAIETAAEISQNITPIPSRGVLRPNPADRLHHIPYQAPTGPAQIPDWLKEERAARALNRSRKTEFNH